MTKRASTTSSTHRQILFRYADQTGAVNAAGNPNGSLSNIAGIRNRAGNVFGMMPHPERAVEAFHPSVDGIAILRAFLASRPVVEEVKFPILCHPDVRIKNSPTFSPF